MPKASPVKYRHRALLDEGLQLLGPFALRGAVNCRCGKKHESFCLIDIKEATPPAAPRAKAAPIPKESGKRVVEGARQLSPALGDRMMAGKFSAARWCCGT